MLQAHIRDPTAASIRAMSGIAGIDRGRLLLYLLIGAVVTVVGLSALRSRGGETETIVPAPRSSKEEMVPALGAMVVDVSGAVRRPGVYRFEPGSRVIDAIRKAGGPTGKAYPGGLNRAALLVDGQQVVLPELGSGGGMVGASGSGTSAGPPVSLGMATAEDLERIEGIGPVTAGKILEFRESKGGLASIDDLDQIPGIGPATMETLRSAIQP